MESVAAATHLHAVRRDEQLRNVRQQQATEHLEVPRVGRDEVQAVVRVRLTQIEHRLNERLQLRDRQLLPRKQARLYPIDRAEPAIRVGPGNVADP